MTILIVTAREDYTADLIVSAADRRGEAVLRLDPAAEDPVRLDAELTGAGWIGMIEQGGRAASLSDISAVMWRWAWSPAGDHRIADPIRRSWAAKEDRAAVFGVLKSLPVRWMNHPDRTSLADEKPVQLTTAKSIGFAVPATLITCKGGSVLGWETAHGSDGLIYKAFYCQGVDEGGMVPASPVDLDALPRGDLYAASLFQRLIRGRPVRTTVVGERVFSAVIEPQEDALDWRPGQQAAQLSDVETPPDIVHRLHRFMAHFALEYGAFDFIVEPSGTWWFLEINPTGQYGFVEIKTGMPITAAIIDRLSSPVDSPVDSPGATAPSMAR